MTTEVKTSVSVSEAELKLSIKSRAQNNGWSTVSERLKAPIDRSLFNIAGHFDRQHMIFSQKLYNNAKQMSNSDVSHNLFHCSYMRILVTGQEQILTGLKSS